MTAHRQSDLKAIDVGGEAFLAVAMEARLRSQGIRVERLDPDIESPAPFFQYRLLVHADHLPLALEMLEELSAIEDFGPESIS